jgi:hypothetical protein
MLSFNQFVGGTSMLSLLPFSQLRIRHRRFNFAYSQELVANYLGGAHRITITSRICLDFSVFFFFFAHGFWELLGIAQ